MFHLRFGLSDHLKALLDFVFGSRRRVKKVHLSSVVFTRLSLQRRVVFLTVETCLGMYDCVSLISGYWAICLRRSTERVRTVSPSRLTSVLATVLCLVLGVGFCCWLVFSCFGSSCLVVFLFSPVHHTLRHT